MTESNTNTGAVTPQDLINAIKYTLSSLSLSFPPFPPFFFLPFSFFPVFFLLSPISSFFHSSFSSLTPIIRTQLDVGVKYYSSDPFGFCDQYLFSRGRGRKQLKRKEKKRKKDKKRTRMREKLKSDNDKYKRYNGGDDLTPHAFGYALLANFLREIDPSSDSVSCFPFFQIYLFYLLFERRYIKHSRIRK